MRSDPAVISRREFKQNIRPITDEDLEMIMKLQPVQYQYKKAPTEDRFGLIVEDVERVMPQLVSWETTPPPKSSVGYDPSKPSSSSTGTRRPYALKYENLTALLLAFVQRLVRQRQDSEESTTVASPTTLPLTPRSQVVDVKPLSPVADTSGCAVGGNIPPPREAKRACQRGEPSPIKLPMLETTQAMTRLAAEDGDCVLYFRKPMTRGCYFIGTRLDGLYYEQAVRMGGGVSLATMIR